GGRPATHRAAPAGQLEQLGRTQRDRRGRAEAGLMNVLGLSFYYHDSSAALVKDGVLVAAAEEERFSRRKHDSGFPKLAIEFALKQGGISLHDVDYVVFYEKPFVKFERMLLTAMSTFP